MSGPSVVEDIFLAALEKGTPEERAAFLDAACKDDAEENGYTACAMSVAIDDIQDGLIHADRPFEAYRLYLCPVLWTNPTQPRSKSFPNVGRAAFRFAVRPPPPSVKWDRGRRRLRAPGTAPTASRQDIIGRALIRENRRNARIHAVCTKVRVVRVNQGPESRVVSGIRRRGRIARTPTRGDDAGAPVG